MVIQTNEKEFKGKTLQEYLNNKYPSQEEKKYLATELNIEKINREREKQGIKEKLEGGELDLKEYSTLIEIEICGLHLKTPLTRLELPQQKYLRKIICCDNQLANLDLSSYSYLTEILLGNNQFTSVNFLKTIPHPERLEKLEIYDNNIQPTTLDFLRPFVNLKDCKLGLNAENKDYPSRIEENFYNRFYGSLESIKNLTKLEEFCIAGTDVEEGIEYIPELITNKSHEGALEDSKFDLNPSIPNNPNQNEVLANFFRALQLSKGMIKRNNLERNLIDCRTLRPEAKVKKIQDELRPFNYDILAWQLAHPHKMYKAQPHLFELPESREKWLNAVITKIEKSQQKLEEVKIQEPDKVKKIKRMELKIDNLNLVKKLLEERSIFEDSLNTGVRWYDKFKEDKATQTDLTMEQIEKWERADKKNKLTILI